jgi:hypothetical protein
VAGLYGIDLPLLAVLPILIGAQIIVRPLMRRVAIPH